MSINNVGSVNINTQTFEKATSAANTTVALTANTLALVAAANTNRKFLHVTNNSAIDATISLGATAVAGSGNIVKGGGGSFSITQMDMYTGAVSAIAASAISLSVCEGS